MDYKFINTEYLDSISGGDTEIICELLRLFQSQSAEIYNEMIRYNSSKDYRSLSLLAHKAKSSIAILGMDDLASMLKTLELQAKEGLEDQLYLSYINRFKTESDAAIAELEDLVRNH